MTIFFSKKRSVTRRHYCDPNKRSVTRRHYCDPMTDNETKNSQMEYIMGHKRAAPSVGAFKDY